MIQDVSNYLHQYGVKPSVQRIAVMDYLLTHKTHPTVDEIFVALYPNMPTLSKTTVYNTLRILVEKGAALSLDIDERNTRFDGDITPHLHFRCKGCGAIHDLPMEQGVSFMPVQTDKLQITEVQVYCKGYCATCKTN